MFALCFYELAVPRSFTFCFLTSVLKIFFFCYVFSVVLVPGFILTILSWFLVQVYINSGACLFRSIICLNNSRLVSEADSGRDLFTMLSKKEKKSQRSVRFYLKLGEQF